MASSKRQSGEVEVFETSDAEEEDERKTGEDYEDVDSEAETVEEIERIHLKATSAYETFSELERGRRSCDVYQLSDENAKLAETMNPVTKFRALKRRVAELADELESLATAEEEGKKSRMTLFGSAEDIAEASKGTYVLRQRLEAIEADERLKSFVDPEARLLRTLTSQSDVSAQLMRDIERFAGNQERSPPSVSANDSKSDDGEGARLTYELYMDDGASRVRGDGSFGNMEKRLHDLETRVGEVGDGSATPSLIDAVRDMESRVRLLDEETLNALSRRMKTVGSEYEAFARRMARARSKSGGASNPVRAQKLAKALEQIEVYEQQSAALPTIVERLRTLRTIHEESARFVQRLDLVERTQKETLDALERTRSVLSAVEKGLAENMAVVSENVKQIDGRVERVLEQGK